jgi:hypothetical protein
MSNQATVADISAAHWKSGGQSERDFKDLKRRSSKNFRGSRFVYDRLTIPEYDNIAPKRLDGGASRRFARHSDEDWAEIAHCYLISLDRSKLPKQSGREDDPEKEWRNRHKGIAEARSEISRNGSGDL